MGAHINPDGKFQSDKYPTCPPGKVPLSVADKTAQDLLWEYAQRRRAVDAEFAEDLEACLRAAGFTPTERPESRASDVLYCQGCGDGLEPDPTPTLCLGCVSEALHRGVDPDPEELRKARLEQGPL